MSKATVEHVHFTITGEYMTFIARDMVISGMWWQAMTTLKEGLIGISMEQCIALLDGSQKLIGDSNKGMDMAPDSIDDPDTAKYLATMAFQYAHRLRIGSMLYEPYAVVTGYGQCDVGGPPRWLSQGRVRRPYRGQDGFEEHSYMSNQDFTYSRAMWHADNYDTDVAFMVEVHDDHIGAPARKAVLFRPVITTTPFWIKENKTAQDAVDGACRVGRWLDTRDGCKVDRQNREWEEQREANRKKWEEELEDIRAKKGCAPKTDYLDSLIPAELRGVAEGVKAHINGTQDWESKPEVSEHKKFMSGYVDRKGNFYGCEYMAHAALATRILKHMFDMDEAEDPQKELDNKGFVRLQKSAMGPDIMVMCEKKPTKSQINAVFDHSEAWGVWVENTQGWMEDGGCSTITCKKG